VLRLFSFANRERREYLISPLEQMYPYLELRCSAVQESIYKKALLPFVRKFKRGRAASNTSFKG
jgi:hypothetical protein